MADFKERGKAVPVVHFLKDWSKGSEWNADCGSSEAADSENMDHCLSSRKERVTCPKCLEIMNAKATAEKEPTKG